MYEYIPMYIFTQGRGGGAREKVRGALVHKRGRKYQKKRLFLQSINSIRENLRAVIRGYVCKILFPARKSLLSDILAGNGKIGNFFYSVVRRGYP
jgi:hypothetical protein